MKKTYEWLELSGAKFGDTNKENLAISLIEEEFKELFEAYKNRNFEEIKDAYIDIQWVLLNLTYFMGISIQDLENFSRKVEISNYSKFCKSKEEAIETVYAYENGVHWDKEGIKIDCYFKQVGDYFVIKRSDNNKILKSINYTPVKNVILWN